MNCIVAVDQNWNIGNKGQLLISIPEDMSYFRKMTTGKTIVMGRKTFESFPNQRPLPKRRNIILTNNPEYMVDGAEICTSQRELMVLLKDTPHHDVFVIGGGQIYEMLLPFCQKAYVTRIFNEYGADTRFPNLDIDTEWKLVHKSEMKEWNDVRFVFCEYERI